MLNILPEVLGKKQKHLIVNLITAVRIVWVKHWKAEMIQSKQELIENFLKTAEMDILTVILKDKEDQKTFGNHYMNGLK